VTYFSIVYTADYSTGTRLYYFSGSVVTPNYLAYEVAQKLRQLYYPSETTPMWF
jgi:hypothetical protein